MMIGEQDNAVGGGWGLVDKWHSASLVMVGGLSRVHTVSPHQAHQQSNDQENSYD